MKCVVYLDFKLISCIWGNVQYSSDLRRSGQALRVNSGSQGKNEESGCVNVCGSGIALQLDVWILES